MQIEETIGAIDREEQKWRIDRIGDIDTIAQRLPTYVERTQAILLQEQTMDAMQTPTAPLNKLNVGLMDFPEDTPPDEKAQRTMVNDLLIG